MNTKEPMYKNDLQTICHKICYQHQCVSSLAYHSLFPYRGESTDNRVQLWKGGLEQGVEGNHGRCPIDGYSRVWVTRGSVEEISRTFQKRKPQKRDVGAPNISFPFGVFQFQQVLPPFLPALTSVCSLHQRTITSFTVCRQDKSL